MSQLRFIGAVLLLLLAAPVATRPCQAQVEAGQADDGSAQAQLAVEQARLADKYKELERLLLRMAEVIQPTDPKRAALLRQAFTQSKERQVNLQFEDLVKLLETEQLYQAGKGQSVVEQDLEYLLQLLLSGERDKQIPNERVQLKRFIDRINKLIREQQGVQGETEGSGDPDDLAERQEQIADKTAKLAKDVNQFESDRMPKTDGEPTDGEGEKQSSPGEGEKSDNGEKFDKSDSRSGQKKSADPSHPMPGEKPGETDQPKAADGKPDSASEKPDSKQPSPSDQKSDSQQGSKQQGDPSQQQNQPSQEQGDPSQQEQGEQSDPSKSSGGKSQQGSQPSPGESSDIQSDQQQSQRDDSPARRRIQQAEERMRDAKKRLEEAKKRGAAEDQQKAIEELKQAKAELEEILRQLREEEIERVLVMLETRFRKMLQMQVEVYEGTLRLDRIPEDEWDRDLDIEAGKLSRTEALITAEADKALTLLREEGSSVAFPESVEQMREDMEQVTSRLARASVGRVTQGLEQDIIKALEETIAALQKAQKDAQKRKNQRGGGGGDMDQSLVDQIAELKMIRALQMRVNTRTQRYSRMLADGAEQAEQPELIEAIKKLAEREQRIYRTTRDIVVGRNQ